MGPSGCGKSTLLNLIAGLDRPTSGTIMIGGRSTDGLDDAGWTQIRRTQVGMVFQSFHLLPGLTASENVALPLLLNGRSEIVSDRVRECLDAVGMAHRAHHRPAELSGGEQQRVAIARALVHRPALLLADEPTGNLDSAQGAAIIALLREVTGRGGQTVLLVTHSAEAANVADDVHVMRDGVLLTGGGAQEAL
jgi:ABC-type lipoprotein export system ATPase subunit